MQFCALDVQMTFDCWKNVHLFFDIFNPLSLWWTHCSHSHPQPQFANLIILLTIGKIIELKKTVCLGLYLV